MSFTMQNYNFVFMSQAMFLCFCKKIKSVTLKQENTLSREMEMLQK